MLTVRNGQSHNLWSSFAVDRDLHLRSTPLLMNLAPYRKLIPIFSAESDTAFTTTTTIMAYTSKKTVLIIGGGAVGAIAALNLDVGGFADVTIVLRSNYEAVQESGYDFESCDHGTVKSWKPSVGRY